jgi:fibro-slime domain-containing protein
MWLCGSVAFNDGALARAWQPHPRWSSDLEDFVQQITSRSPFVLKRSDSIPVMPKHAMWKAILGRGAVALRIVTLGPHALSPCRVRRGPSAPFGLLLLGCSAVACGAAGGGAGISDDDDSRPRYMGGSPQASALPAMSPGSEQPLFEDDPAQIPTNGGCGSNLTGVLRDFKDSHPDFGDAVADDRGLVQRWLGTDRKPVYAPAGPTATTSGPSNFNQWYRDTPDVNQSREFVLPFQDRGNGISTYDNPAFFPLDQEMFGNENQDHNYHFTFELHTEFAYRGGEVFTFAGDDDLFVFINGQLAIDLGGVHGTQTDSVDLDAEAETLGLTAGGSYPLDLFQAERHATGSTFRVDTSLLFTSCGTIILR